METAFRLLSGVQKDFFRNLLWQQQQPQNINQFRSSPSTAAISETSSGNAFDEREENSLDQQKR